MHNRRNFLQVLGLGAATVAFGRAHATREAGADARAAATPSAGTTLPAPALATHAAFGAGMTQAIAACERDSRGRLGVALLDTGNGARFGWRGGERFAMCSTFKLPLVVAVLHRVDTGKEQLARRVSIAQADIIAHSPFSELHIGARGASVAELCKATLTLSDNAAANLLLPAVGGPAGLTAWLRSTGDRHTRLDRNEPSLNTAIIGDPRDTTTPDAMVDSLQRMLLGDVLSPASRKQLVDWLVANQTGGPRLRAGFPRAWRVGDKTGSGNGTTNDIAIVWRGTRAPLLVATYLTQSPLDNTGRDAIVARIGKAIAVLG